MATVAAIAAPAQWQIDPHRIDRIAVVCGDRLFVFAHRDPRAGCVDVAAYWQIPEDGDLSDIARVAFAAGVGSVWILPLEGGAVGPNDPPWIRGWSVYTRLAMAKSAMAFTWHELSANRGTALAGAVAQRLGEDGRGHGLPLGMYATWIDAWPVLAPLAALRCPEQRARELATGLALAAFALDVQLRYSPSYTGIAVLRETLAAKRYAIPPISEDMRDLLDPLLPGPIQWRGPLPERLAGKQRIRIYKYDRIGSYLASAREVPVGDPVLTDEYHEKLPGCYQVTARAPASWPAELPGIFRAGSGAGDYPREVVGVWAWEPQIRLAERQGWHVLIRDGFYWPKEQKHDLLRAWQQRVWGARVAAEAYPGPAGAVAKAIAKKIGVATVGRLKQKTGHMLVSAEVARTQGWRVESRDTDQRGRLTGLVEVIGELGKTDLLWPHVWATIIAGANERLQSAMITHAPLDTLAAYVDALYTSRPHAELAHGDQLGKFRLERRQVVARGLLDPSDLLDEALSAQAFVKLLAHVAPAPDPETDPYWLDDEVE